eukprot:CAMPEP_0202363676 /NCGR_PEP_ID=MMETSP1126-20121109/15374_1 /ASSEMBLY_ACC=CAM_ASM_000457 /TAXON_ID=3047 /ORGANISM="Dunaliella tertiolecta, Strain CCMP1320" /LENGTH=84 /DNA_ID=CAMNT_0048958137 /DNA_START=248 /DNA_END=502 /DNA_ORIENTATION=-
MSLPITVSSLSLSAGALLQPSGMLSCKPLYSSSHSSSSRQVLCSEGIELMPLLLQHLLALWAAAAGAIVGAAAAAAGWAIVAVS